MFKKIICLVLSGFLFMQINGFFVFAQNPERMDLKSLGQPAKKVEVDRCSAYPKNECGQTVDVNCAIRKAYQEILENPNEKSYEFKEIGNKCKTDLYFWKYDGLGDLASTFNDWIIDTNKEEKRNQFIGKFIGETEKVFNLNSTQEAAAIVNQWVQNSRYTKNIEITKKDIEDWITQANSEESNYQNVLSSNEIGTLGAVAGGATGWGVGAYLAGAAFASSVIPFAVAGGAILGIGCKFVGLYYGKEAKISEKSAEHFKNSIEQKVRLNVYSHAIERIFHSVRRKEYVGNDILMAKLYFNEDNRPDARVSFKKLGLNKTNQNITQIFNDLSRTLVELMYKYNLNKEEL